MVGSSRSRSELDHAATIEIGQELQQHGKMGWMPLPPDGIAMGQTPFEPVNRAAPVPVKRTDHLFEAMIEVVLDECIVRLGDGLFDGMKLLADVEARATGFDHLDDASQMAISAPQSFDDVQVASMRLGDLVRSTMLSSP
jgi:hypothetical protein